MRSLGLFVSLILAAAGGPAPAADGVREINQACASGGGCFAGDNPGFPVEITQPGSYVLTGVISPPDRETDAIFLSEDFITLDLNGFGILYPEPGCAPGNCQTGSGKGISFLQPFWGNRVTVRNGFVRNAGDHGIKLRNFPHVEDVTVSNVGGFGIDAGGEGIIRANRITRNGGHGVAASSSTIVSENTISFSGLAGFGHDLWGGAETSGNYCRDRTCSRVVMRKYYMAAMASRVNGSQALDACAPGYHMASLMEIQDTSNLRYATELSDYTMSHYDAGSGPPKVYGWIRTGAILLATHSTGAGKANCERWTSASPGINGSIAMPSSNWVDVISPAVPSWWGTADSCDSTWPVWCVED